MDLAVLKKMEASMKENSRMEKKKALARKSLLTSPGTLGNGRTIRSMAKVVASGKTEPVMSVNGKRTSTLDLERNTGPMETHTRDCGLITRSTAKEATFGPLETDTTDLGLTESNMAMVNSFGLLVPNTLATSKTT